MARRFDAVLFDLDNTLWHFNDSPPPHEAAAAFAPRIQAMVESWGQRASVSYAELDLQILAAEEAALTEAMSVDYHEPDMTGVALETLARYGVRATRGQANELRRVIWPDPTLLRPRLFEGVLETLDTMRSAGVALAAVTNRSHGADILAGELEYHGLHKAFDTVVVAADIGWRKPHPAMFEHALRTLDVTAERALMVGDRANRDIEGARALGITSVLAHHPGMPESPIDGAHQQPHHRISSMAELLDVVRSSVG